MASDDSGLFRQSVGNVKPLDSDRTESKSPKPKPVARFSREDSEAVLQESLTGGPDARALGTGEELDYLKAGIPRTVLRKLRRGAYAVEAEIDLHGLNVAEAKSALDEFFAECLRLDVRCVRVIHGKGRGSGNRGPVLKNKVNVWLRRRADVVTFVSARPTDGGTGAVYVLVRKN